MALIYTLLTLWLFWALYVFTMGVYRAYLDKRLTWPMLILSLPFVALGLLIDVLAQFTVAVILFQHLPRLRLEWHEIQWLDKTFTVPWIGGEWLVTDRLTRYMKEGSGRRYRWAKWICTHLLDVFDPRGKHC